MSDLIKRLEAFYERVNHPLTWESIKALREQAARINELEQFRDYANKEYRKLEVKNKRLSACLKDLWAEWIDPDNHDDIYKDHPEYRETIEKL